MFQVAHHGERRLKKMFHPNKGMLFPLDDHHVKLLRNGELDAVTVNISVNNGNYYSLNDRFHQRSKKKEC